MPVRIYEIARKVGIPSKEVLAKAKELGITNAKVASSTLDKITAEYLEEEIAGKPDLETNDKKDLNQSASEPVIITAPKENNDLQESQPTDELSVEEPTDELSDEEPIPEEVEKSTEPVESVQPSTKEKSVANDPSNQEKDKEEEEESDLGKKVGFIELGNMAVRPTIRERKKKKDKKTKRARRTKMAGEIAQAVASFEAGQPQKSKNM